LIRLFVIPAKAGIHEHNGASWSDDDVHGSRPSVLPKFILSAAAGGVEGPE